MAEANPPSFVLRIGPVLQTAAVAVFFGTVIAAPLLHGALDDAPRFALRCGAFGALTLSLLTAAVRRRIWTGPWSSTLALLAFLGTVWLSAWASDYTYGSAQSALDFTVLGAGFIAAMLMVRNTALRTVMLIGLLLAMGAVAVGGGLQVLGMADVPDLQNGRASAWFRNPNHFAGMLDLAAPLALGTALFAGSMWTRLLGVILVPLFYVVLGTTFSYGGWLSTGLATLGLVIFWVVQGFRRSQGWARASSALAMILVGTLALGLFLAESPRLRGSAWERIQTVVDVRGVSSFRSRITIQRAAWEMARDHPWLGVGPGNFAVRIAGYRPASAESGSGAVLHTTVLHPLNDLLNVATSSGFLSLIAFLAFWIFALARAVRYRSAWRPAILAGLTAMLLHGLVDGNLTYVTGNGFLAFVLLGALQADSMDPVSPRTSRLPRRAAP